jgi:competence protein ComEC
MDSGLSVVEHSPFASVNKIWLTRFEYLLLYAVILAMFCFIYNKKVWLLRFALLSTLILAMSITFKRWHNSLSNELIVLNLRKHTGIILRSGNRATVLTDLSDTDKTYRYSIQPYLDSCQVAEAKVQKPGSDIHESYLIKKGNLISFAGKTMLLYDKLLPEGALPEKLKIDYLVMSGSPAMQSALIGRNYDYKMLVFDRNNSKTLTSRLENNPVATSQNYMMTDSNKSIKLLSN